MVSGGRVLSMLCPDVEWVINDNDYDSINWFGKEPAVTREQFEAGFAQYEELKAQQEAERLSKRQALLDKLGITEEEAKLLLS